MRHFINSEAKRLSRLVLLRLFISFVSFNYRIRNEGHILHKSTWEIFRQFLTGFSVVYIDDHWQIIGHLTLWHLRDNWYESGTMWVHPNYREHGLAKQMKIRLLREFPQYRIITTTTNPIVVKLNLDPEVGMKIFDFWSLPQEIHLATCVCSRDKTGTENNLHCRLKNSECRLLM